MRKYSHMPVPMAKEFEIDNSGKYLLSERTINEQNSLRLMNQSRQSTSNKNSKSSREVTIKDFQILRKLGQGAYGKVYLASNNDKEYSIKTLNKDFLIKHQKVKSVYRERDILLSGKNCFFLPKLHHCFDDAESLYLVMEYIPNGTLEEFIKKHCSYGFKKEIVQFYAAQIILTLEYL